MVFNSQQQKLGDNSTGYQAGGDMIFINESDKKDLEIIDEIFKNVIKDIKKGKKFKVDNEHLDISKKIKFNFEDKEDQVRVQEYFKRAYATVLDSIGRRIQVEDNVVQGILADHIFSKYNKLKDSGITKMETLEQLFEQFIIDGKKDNPYYTNCARGFVLFFFDDCTIFEKK